MELTMLDGSSTQALLEGVTRCGSMVVLKNTLQCFVQHC